MSAQVNASVHPLAPWLRARVLALRAATRRRVFPACLELVTQAAPPAQAAAGSWRYGELTPGPDHALRVDALVRLLTDCGARGLRTVTAVHVRPGPHQDPTDVDLGWLRAATAAAHVSDTDVVSVVALSRWGWHDLRTGQQRTWRRLRR